VKTLGLLMFAMAGLLVIGVFVAVLMVRLRNKIIERLTASDLSVTILRNPAYFLEISLLGR